MKLKTTLSLILMIALSFTLANCSTSVHTTNAPIKSKPLPPGQAKKINGDKSAKKYAPGQNKH